MSKQPRDRRILGVKYAALAAILGLLLAAVICFMLGDRAMYTPFALPALILLMPAAINLLTALPLWLSRRVPTPSTEAADDPAEPCEAEAPAKEPSAAESSRPRRRRPLAILRSACAAVGAWLSRRRTVLMALGVIVAITVVNAMFWQSVRREVMSTLLSFYMAVVMLVGALFLLILSKWCKHATPTISHGEKDADGARYAVALMRSLQAALAMGALTLLLTALTVALRTLDIYDFSRVLVIVLTVLFVYQTVFLAISLFVVLVRREMTTAPELMAPMPGVRYGSIGVLDYLEKNTGISMRSLWSIRLIGRAIPYAVLLSLVLLWLGTGVVMIGSEQRGAHYHFGKLDPEPLAPGLHMTLPWPFDEVKVYDTETIGKMTIGYITEGTGDNLWTEAHGTEEYRLLVGGGKELVSINLKVEYRIGDLYRYLTCTNAPELLLGATSYEIVTAHTIGSDLDTLLSVDRTVFSQSFKEELVGEMERYGTGLEIVSVVLESIHPPVEVAEAYQALNSAYIDAERMIINAEAYAFERLAWAQISYDTSVALANIEKSEAVADAEAALAEFMASVEADKSNSDAYRYYKYLQALTDAYEGARLIIVGDGINEGNIFIGNIGN